MDKDKQIFQMQQKGFGEISKELQDMKKAFGDAEVITVKGRQGDVGYTPVKGKDYFTKSEVALITKDIIDSIRVPKDGEPGEDGDDGISPEVDYKKLESFIKAEVSKIKLPKVENGKDAVVDYNSIIIEVIKRIPDVDINPIKEYVRQEVQKIAESRPMYRQLNSGGPTTRLGELVDVDTSNTTVGYVLGRLANGEFGMIAQSGGGGGSSVSVNTVSVTNPDFTDTANIKFNVAGPVVTADLSAGVTASLALANSALQSGANISLLTNNSGYTTNIGTVTSVGTGTGLTGGPITGSGTIALNSASIASLALADSALQLDQTIPQTTVGMFTFPEITIGSLGARRVEYTGGYLRGFNGSNVQNWAIGESGDGTFASVFITGGTASDFLKADGTLDSNTYLTSYTETDTLASVTGRGATTAIQSTFSGGLLTGLGSVSLPAYSFAPDPNTGMYSPISDTLAWSTGGVERMRINSSGRVSINSTLNASTLDVTSTSNASTGGIGLRVYALNRSQFASIDWGGFATTGSLSLVGGGSGTFIQTGTNLGVAIGLASQATVNARLYVRGQTVNSTGAGVGTVSTTVGSNIVTGVGTDLNVKIGAGYTITIGANTYPVASVQSATQITLYTNAVATVSGSAWDFTTPTGIFLSNDTQRHFAADSLGNLIIKGTSPQFIMDRTSGKNWSLSVDTVNNGRWALNNVTNSTVPFYVDGSAPDGSFKINASGNVELTQTVTTEAIVSDRSVTVVINGTTYKLLARA